MVARRAVLALVFVLIGFGVSAQESAEFGRATGGEIVLTPKGSAPFSGSLDFSLSSSPSYGVTAGGMLLQDRLWFFGSASRQQGSRFARLELPDDATTGAIAARLNGQISGNQDFSAFFENIRQPAVSMTAPSSFLSLRYTGIVSNNMFVNASFTRRQ